MADDFDIKTYLANERVRAPENDSSDFDIHSYLANERAAPAKPTSAKMAALEHFGNALSLNYAPQLQAAAEPLTNKLFAALTGQKDPGSDQSYVQRRDENIARMAQEKSEHPWASNAGTVGGLVTGGIAGSGIGAPVKGASALANIGQAAKTGALYGALQNPGDTEGELAPAQLSDRARNGLVGGIAGGAIGAATQGLQGLSGGASDSLRDAGEVKAFRASGPTAKDMLKAQSAGKENQYGRILLDNKIVTPLATKANIADRLNVAKDEAGQIVGNIIDTVNEKISAKIDPKLIAKELAESPDIKNLDLIPGQEATANKVRQILETLSKNEPLDLREAQTLRKNIDSGINYNKRIPDMTGAQPHLYEMRNAIRDKMNEAVNGFNSQFPGVESDALLNANNRYSDLSTLEQIAEHAKASSASRNTLGLGEKIMGGLGGMIGSPLGPKGVAAGMTAGVAAGKAGSSVGNSLAANALDAGANLVQGAGNAAGAIGQSSAIPATAGMQNLLNSYQKAKAASGQNEDRVLSMFRENPALIDKIQDPTLKESIKRQLDRGPSQDSTPNSHGVVSEQQAQDQFIQGNK